jgi:hypothetical protein
MTMQADDYVHIGKKKYTLIDVEMDKQIITYADFIMPENKGREVISTDCWRGYTAEYFVVRKTLYGIKYQKVYFEGSTKKISSSKIKIPYTGSCIIAYSDDARMNSDFLNSYINYDEAFELYFENGVLKEKNTLISAIEKATALFETDEYKNKMKRDEWAHIREKIAREPLKYKYDKSTYRWRYR